MSRALTLLAGLTIYVAATSPAVAGALASASLDIVSFTWYLDSNNNGLPDPVSPSNPGGDVPLTAAVPDGPGLTNEDIEIVPNILSGAVGEERAASSANPSDNIGMDATGSQSRRIDLNTSPGVRNLNDALDLRDCVGADCGNSAVRPPANDFSPIAPGVNGQFVAYDQLWEGFFVDATGVNNAGAATGGLRADVSLTVPDLDQTYDGFVSARQLTSTPLNVVAQGTGSFDTYFSLTYQAQALAQLTSGNPGSNSTANARFVFQVLAFPLQGSGTDNEVWQPTEINNLAAQETNPGQIAQADSGPVPVTIHSWTSTDPDMFTLAGGTTYQVQWTLEASANALTNSPPVGAPTPATTLLLVAGLLGMAAAHRRRIG